MISKIKHNSKPAEAGDRIIGQEIQNHKPLKAVTEPLFKLSLCHHYRGLFYINFYAIILPLLSEFDNASLRLVYILWTKCFSPY